MCLIRVFGRPSVSTFVGGPTFLPDPSLWGSRSADRLHFFNASPCYAQCTLISLFLFVRHGARHHFRGRARLLPVFGAVAMRLSPLRTASRSLMAIPFFSHRILLREHFPARLCGGELLDIGFAQLRALGSSYRKYLTNAISLLTPACNTAEVLVRSTGTSRTVASAVWFMDGLYRPEKDGGERRSQWFSRDDRHIKKLRSDPVTSSHECPSPNQA
jgi:hypothetical protein